MTCRHNHQPTERFKKLSLEEQLAWFKQVKENMIKRNDLELLDCINWDIEETERKINEQRR